MWHKHLVDVYFMSKVSDSCAFILTRYVNVIAFHAWYYFWRAVCSLFCSSLQLDFGTVFTSQQYQNVSTWRLVPVFWCFSPFSSFYQGWKLTSCPRPLTSLVMAMVKNLRSFGRCACVYPRLIPKNLVADSRNHGHVRCAAEDLLPVKFSGFWNRTCSL